MDSMATTDIEAQIEARFKTTAAARWHRGGVWKSACLGVEVA